MRRPTSFAVGHIPAAYAPAKATTSQGDTGGYYGAAAILARMPLYDYRCDLCEAQFEVRQSFNEEKLGFCPAEGGPAACTSPGEGPVKKVFSGVGISFKGDGFYKNDHGANASGRRKEREAASSKDSSGSSDSGDSSKASDAKTSTGSAGSSSEAKKPAKKAPGEARATAGTSA